MVRLRWRESTGSRRSLGWIPFKKTAIQAAHGQVKFAGQWLSLWDSYGITSVPQYSIPEHAGESFLPLMNLNNIEIRSTVFRFGKHILVRLLSPISGLKTADAGSRCAAAPVGQVLDAGRNAAQSIDLHAAHE
jgi:hypothetical protein